jgi:stage II sporulation protein D
MPASYPNEALKAMAVIARTFSTNLKDTGKHKKDGFNVCDTIHCQVYGGVLNERESSNKAVSETSGIIATYNGKPAFTTFHAVCGGFGANVTSVWSGQPYSFLTGGFDGSGDFSKNLSKETDFKDFINSPPNCYCMKAGRFRWTEKYKKSELESCLSQSIKPLTGMGTGTMNIGKLQTVRITERTPDGRAQTMEVVTSTGTYKILKDKMRWITTGGKISTAGLPSTFFYIEENQDITFKGGGWGHGVGLCQEGARGLAESGKNFEDIIKHYYKGVTLWTFPKS